jgi:hypothetical protein
MKLTGEYNKDNFEQVSGRFFISEIFGICNRVMKPFDSELKFVSGSGKVNFYRNPTAGFNASCSVLSKRRKLIKLFETVNTGTKNVRPKIMNGQCANELKMKAYLDSENCRLNLDLLLIKFKVEPLGERGSCTFLLEALSDPVSLAHLLTGLDEGC